MSVTVLYCGNGLNIQFYIYQTCLKFHLQHKSMANIVNFVNTFGVRTNCIFGGFAGNPSENTICFNPGDCII